MSSAELRETFPSLVAEIVREAASAEQARVLAIQELDAPPELIAELIRDLTVSAGEAALHAATSRKARDKALGARHLARRNRAEEELKAPDAGWVTQDIPDDRARARAAVALHRQVVTGQPES